METRKGSNTFRMHLARISIDGTDQPVGREATLCLCTQRDETKTSNTSEQLMTVYIDGRLMVSLPDSLFYFQGENSLTLCKACWDFARLKQHLSYHLIHIFSSFTLSKHISLTLPLPLKSETESQDYDDCLKAIRVYFTKAQDFHTAISWLTKQADLKRLDGRPASSNGVRASISTTSEKSARSAVRRTMAPLTQIVAPLSQEKPGSRPQSRSGQHPAAQQSGSLQSQLSGLSTQAPTRQHTDRAISRGQSRNTMRQVVRDFSPQQRQPILRRDMFAAQEAGPSAMGPPPTGGVAFADHELSGSKTPRVGSLPNRAMSAARLRGSRFTSYSRDGGRRFIGPSSTALDAPTGRRSPYNFRNHARGVPTPDSSQEPPILGGLYLPHTSFESIPDTTSRHSQIQRLTTLSTQSNIAADSMDVDAADLQSNVPDDTARRLRVTSMTLPDARIPGASPDQLPSDWRPTTSSQVAQVGRNPHTLPLQSSATLFASTGVMGQDAPDQELSFELAPGTRGSDRGSDQRQNDIVGKSRPPSAQALQLTRETNRKANQTMKRAGRRMSYDQSVGVQAPAAVSETQVETSGPTVLVAPSLGPKNTTIAAHRRSETPMVDCATQTSSWPRFHADILHLSAAMRLDARLLRDTKQWGTLEDVNKELLSLSAEFVQGIYDILKST